MLLLLKQRNVNIISAYCKKITRMILSQKMETSDWVFSAARDSLCFYCFCCSFLSGWKWRTQVLCMVTICRTNLLGSALKMARLSHTWCVKLTSHQARGVWRLSELAPCHLEFVWITQHKHISERCTVLWKSAVMFFVNLSRFCPWSWQWCLVWWQLTFLDWWNNTRKTEWH